MSVFERRVLFELQKLREAEVALEGMYRTLGGGADRVPLGEGAAADRADHGLRIDRRLSC